MKCPGISVSLAVTKERGNFYESKPIKIRSAFINVRHLFFDSSHSLWHFVFSHFLYRPDQKKDDIGLLRTMAAGSVGGICLWTAIFPADVIKSRVQISNIKMNMFVMGLNIARTEGITALYNGLKPTLIRTIPATAVLFVVYEYSKKFMTQIF